MFYYALFSNTKPYGARHVHKPLLGSSVTNCWLACSEISLSINERELQRSLGNERTQFKLVYGVTALTMCFVL